MIRALVTALLCAAAIVAGDVLFRTSLLREVRPLVLSPPEQAVVSPPVEVRWEGPEHMQVLLAADGEDARDLGVHASPLPLGAEQFPRSGGYEIELRSPRFGDWIDAVRWFQVQAPPSAPPPRTPAARGAPTPAADQELLRAVEAARAARDRAEEQAQALREENAALHEESERLGRQLDALSKTQAADDQRQADLESRLTALAQQNRALAEENAALRQRLSRVLPCSVWGYLSYPQLQIIPLTRRLLIVSDLRGQVFRAQIECEAMRRADITAASICFCVGNSFGG